MKYILGKLRASCFAVEFVLSVMVVLIIFQFIKKDQNKIWKVIQAWAKSQCFVAGAKIEVIGEIQPESQMLIANHQSIFDIVALQAISPINLCFVAKKEIESVPILGKVMPISQQISIDRKDRRSSVKIFKDAKIRLEEGRIITMFPEGTRNDGKTLHEFKDGAKLLANKLNLKVQPVVLVNTLPVMNSKDFSARSARVKIICLPIIDRSDEHWLEKSQKEMQEILTKELKALGEL